MKLVKVSDEEGDSSWVIMCCAKYLQVEGKSSEACTLGFFTVTERIVSKFFSKRSKLHLGKSRYTLTVKSETT